jgi:ferredoxin
LEERRIGKPESRAVILEREGLQEVVDLLREKGYCVLGPTVRDGAIIYDEIAGLDDLPEGWTDQQDGGLYRLSRRDDDALFGYTVGPHSWKKFLHPERLRLWRARRQGGEVEMVAESDEIPKFAFLGVRSCELHAISIQDKVFLGNDFQDEDYTFRREDALFIAVNCGQAGGTCFCVSMGTGPEAEAGYDLVLTELLDGGGHRFLVETGSEKGANLLREIRHEEAAQEDHAAASVAVEKAKAGMGRTLDTVGIKELLQGNLDHPRWDNVAARCLTCGNCTMVCPTCFCTTVEDTTDLDGDHAERWRRWDSCFTLDFSYIHGGNVRHSSKSRYRQWMTHKLAHWIDQFGTSGCVGCGRCITWCPVGIDITEEAAAIRSDDVGSRRRG